MLKLTKLTDYAIAVMAQLARQSGEADGVLPAQSATALAEQTGVPEPTVAKVLKTLARVQMVVSIRGVSGGYRLARHPSKVTIGEIIEAIDGPVAIVSCVESDGDDSCQIASRCAVRSKWAPVNTAIRQALHAVTLADMAAPPACVQPARLYHVSLPEGASHAGHE